MRRYIILFIGLDLYSLQAMLYSSHVILPGNHLQNLKRMCVLVKYSTAYTEHNVMYMYATDGD